MRNITILDFKKDKLANKKLTFITCYDYTMAKILEESDIDAVLVGDSLGMTIQGNNDTNTVTVADICYHVRAVRKALDKAFIVADMPFLSYHISDEEAVRNAGELIKAGANAVKMEGGFHIQSRIAAVLNAQIPVMGHLGLTPQSVNVFGGFRVQGRDSEDAIKIIEEARFLDEIGCFAMILECVPMELSKYITENVNLSVIGIGAGVHCDGQVLVIQDLLGMNESKVKFVKKFGNIKQNILDSVNLYSNEVVEGSFPEAQYSFSMKSEEFNRLMERLNENRK